MVMSKALQEQIHNVVRDVSANRLAEINDDPVAWQQGQLGKVGCVHAGL